MKKIFIILSMVCAVLVSCNSTDTVLWNVKAQANGEGKITIEYPTGNPGFVVDGKATAVATTTNDTTANRCSILNDAVDATEILVNPSRFTKEQVTDAEFLQKSVENAVKFHAEGIWEASVTGYAKYRKIYIVIDEHWPSRDSISIE